MRETFSDATMQVVEPDLCRACPENALEVVYRAADVEFGGGPLSGVPHCYVPLGQVSADVPRGL